MDLRSLCLGAGTPCVVSLQSSLPTVLRLALGFFSNFSRCQTKWTATTTQAGHVTLRWWTILQNWGKFNLSLLNKTQQIQLFLLFDATTATTTLRRSLLSKNETKIDNFFPRTRKTHKTIKHLLYNNNYEAIFPPIRTFVVTLKFHSKLVTSPWPSMFRAKCDRAYLNRKILI